MAGRTISFPKGKGSLTHNNRDFIAQNVCEERTHWNRTYIRESLEDAYEKCFGEALREYNAGQKRNDRKIQNYRKKIENSDNRENVFYENIVQLGTKDNTPVVDENGNLTEAAQEAIRLLDEYARTFQERNPNLYLFNCVLHLDEATPHLHIDYIPVATGYKQGMKIRNSITKALQQMGFEKGKGRYQNEVIDWEAREREYLTGLCRERGIEVAVQGDKRDNLTLPEYKEAMRKVEGLEQEADRLSEETKGLFEQRAELNRQANEIRTGIAAKEQERAKIDKKLGKLKSKEKEIQRNVHVYEDEPEWQLPEPSLLMSARDYRTKMAMPLVKKLKKVIFDLTLRCIDALEAVKHYKERVSDLQGEVNNLTSLLRKSDTKIADLQVKERTLDDVREYYGSDRIEAVSRVAQQRRQLEELERRQKRHKDRGIAV